MELCVTFQKKCIQNTEKVQFSEKKSYKIKGKTCMSEKADSILDGQNNVEFYFTNHFLEILCVKLAAMLSSCKLFR